MAKKKSPLPASDEKIKLALQERAYHVAKPWAQKYYESNPNSESKELYKQALQGLAQLYLDKHDLEPLKILLAEAVKLSFTEPEWQRQLALWHAKSGLSIKALQIAGQLGDAALLTQVNGHLADVSIFNQQVQGLSPDWQPAYRAVLEAFKKYHLGHDTAARELLNEIGLTSPYLEWKLLIRGLIAYSTREEDGARANWSRLSPDRLPAKLAAPYHVQVDPSRRSTSGTTKAPIDPSSLLGQLQLIQANLGRNRDLSKAFKSLEAALPTLKVNLPGAVKKLANIFYHAIIRQGQPDDMVRYRKYFGGPADDPDFYRLQGTILEDAGQLLASFKMWQSYEKWLSGPPASWPAPLAQQARALILYRMAKLAEEIEDSEFESPFEELFGFFAQSRNKSTKKVEKDKLDPIAFFQKALELSPEWETAAFDLYKFHLELDQPKEAEAVARKFLARVPNAIPMLMALGQQMAKEERGVEALDLYRQALAINPLDHSIRIATAKSVVGAARCLAIDGKLVEAEQLLVAEAELCESTIPASALAVRSVVNRKQGKKDEAARLAEAAVAVPGCRLSAALELQATSALVKLKPAEKTAANKALTAALTEVPTTQEVMRLYECWRQFFQEGLTYTGQKLQEKKIQDAILTSVKGTSPEIHFETLCEYIQALNQWKFLAKLSELLVNLFRANPVFHLMSAEALMSGPQTRATGMLILRRLRAARELIIESQQERHKKYLPRVDDLFEQMSSFGW